MSDDKNKEIKIEEKKSVVTPAAVNSVKPAVSAMPPRPTNATNGAQSNVAPTGKSMYSKKMGARKPFNRRNQEKDEFEQKIVDLARVTRVMGGGKRMSFRACVAIGNKKGDVGVGISKGSDVTGAISKAVAKAKKDIVKVAIVNDTIPHEIYKKLGASKILFKPAKPGHGIIAGGVVRVILELSGIRDVTSKILGTSNKVSNSKCTLEALRELEK